MDKNHFNPNWRGPFNFEPQPQVSDVLEETKQAARERNESVRDEAHKKIFGEDE